MNETQKEVYQLMKNQVDTVGFTPIQALTMGLSYFKGGYYDTLTDHDFEFIVKTFVAEYM
ncbi:hypothetical protein FQS87_08215 [Enterococcus avium]|uniref:hypothetical protein n=1 Tax=Enterococcus TaxID=1350 RepID=UPI001A96BFC6|nr:hypothetical protein [Enterococcus avium]MBO1139879.1 hypothetical protein [Enterococcus avium]